MRVISQLLRGAPAAARRRIHSTNTQQLCENVFFMWLCGAERPQSGVYLIYGRQVIGIYRESSGGGAPTAALSPQGASFKAGSASLGSVKNTRVVKIDVSPAPPVQLEEPLSRPHV